ARNAFGRGLQPTPNECGNFIVKRLSGLPSAAPSDLATVGSRRVRIIATPVLSTSVGAHRIIRRCKVFLNFYLDTPAGFFPDCVCTTALELADNFTRRSSLAVSGAVNPKN